MSGLPFTFILIAIFKLNAQEPVVKTDSLKGFVITSSQIGYISKKTQNIAVITV
jgi:hypothetical protein